MATLELEARLESLLSSAQAETADIDLFAPIPLREECPICLIPLPINEGFTFFSCCGKIICDGCNHKSAFTEMKKGKRIQVQKCAFCQQTFESTDKKNIKLLKRLMKNNNPQAFMRMANAYRTGDEVFQSHTKALEMYIRAAELGLDEAFLVIANHYMYGIIVEEDSSKAIEFLEVAAKKGCLGGHKGIARFYMRNMDFHSSVQHLKVAASAGDQQSLGTLTGFYKDAKDEIIPKEDLTKTLHAFQASNNETKSKDRDDARKYLAAVRRFNGGLTE